MTHDIDFSEAAIYVGTYAKYNSGSIEGEWLNLSDYGSREEFYEACAELHSDEEDPEYMFQDYENIPKSLISESWMSENIFEVRDAIENLNEVERMAFMIWCDNGHRDIAKEDAEDLLNSFHDDFIGHYGSDEDFAWEIAEEHPEISDFAMQYLDIEAYARDLFTGDYWSHDGYVFYNS